MPLVEVTLPIDLDPPPTEVRAFCQEAMARSDYLLDRRSSDLDAFVPCDPLLVYPVLRALAASRFTPGRMFCEWGAGLGTVACLAAMLDFRSFGIEIEPELVAAARQLADDHELAVEFACGSFVPVDCEAEVEFNDIAWLDTEGEPAYERLGLDLDDFDVVFAYPWPGERRAIDQLFLRAARDGALLVTYDSCAQVAVHRKVGRGGRRIGH